MSEKNPLMYKSIYESKQAAIDGLQKLKDAAFDADVKASEKSINKALYFEEQEENLEETEKTAENEEKGANKPTTQWSKSTFIPAVKQEPARKEPMIKAPKRKAKAKPAAKKRGKKK